MASRLALMRTLIAVGSWLAGILIGVILVSEALILSLLPAKPDASLIGLLQTIQTGLVTALGALIGAIGTGIASYFTFRSVKETSGDDGEVSPIAEAPAAAPEST